jgi:hypothetical protein
MQYIVFKFVVCIRISSIRRNASRGGGGGRGGGLTGAPLVPLWVVVLLVMVPFAPFGLVELLEQSEGGIPLGGDPRGEALGLGDAGADLGLARRKRRLGLGVLFVLGDHQILELLDATREPRAILAPLDSLLARSLCGTLRILDVAFSCANHRLVPARSLPHLVCQFIDCD